MCGFVGQWNTEGRPVDVVRFEQARDRMIDRGPDQFGLWTSTEGHIALGHRRLSILDLSEDGRQPMIDPQTGNILVFNGEIYNFQDLARELRTRGHEFRSRSDSEVILAAYREWGTDCLTRFVGMFAFAIWEPQHERFFLARDPLGVKPLLYASRNGSFFFSSRLEPLLRLLERSPLSDAGLCEFLEMGYTCGSTTLVEGVRKLLPGHFLTFDRHGETLAAYWSVDSFPEEPRVEAHDERDLLDRLDGLVQDSVRLRLVSDVPVGVFLSGGVDSTLVTAVMQQQSADRVRTFTIGFQEGAFDESRHARCVADFLDTQHVELRLDPDALLHEILSTMDALDEPLADTAAVPLSLIARMAREEVKVCLSGDGGDELFLGYPLYNALERVGWMERMPHFARRSAGRLAATMAGRRGRLLGAVARERDALDRYLFLRSRCREVVHRSSGAEWRARAFLQSRLGENCGLPANSLAARLDMRSYLPDELLVKTDLATMMHSLEAREPLLDHRLAAFALALPMPLKQDKRLLKRLLSRYVPPEIWDRPKMGFNVPMDEWLRGPLRFLIDELESEWNLAAPVSQDQIRGLADRHLRGEADCGNFLWTCISLQRWQRKMNPWLTQAAAADGAFIEPTSSSFLFAQKV